MKHAIATGLILIALPALLCAQDSKPDFANELTELRAAYRKAQQDWMAPLTNAKTDAERAKVRLEPGAHPNGTFLPKFKDLAERAKGTAVAFDAGLFVLQNEHNLDLRKDLAIQLMADHADSAKLDAVVASLAYVDQDATLLAALAKLGKHSPHRSVQAAVLMAQVGTGYSNGVVTPDQKLMLEKVAADYADTSHGTQAKSALQILEHYAPGCTPPDFSGPGVDGKEVKLSDFRGRVVMIDFWGYW